MNGVCGEVVMGRGMGVRGGGGGRTGSCACVLVGRFGRAVLRVRGS